MGKWSGEWTSADISEVSPKIDLLPGPEPKPLRKTDWSSLFLPRCTGNPCGMWSVCCEHRSISLGLERWESTVVKHTHTQMDTHSLPVCTNEGGGWRLWCMSLAADTRDSTRERERESGAAENPIMAWSNGNFYWINNLHAEQTGPVARLNRQTGADSGGAAPYSSSPLPAYRPTTVKTPPRWI